MGVTTGITPKRSGSGSGSGSPCFETSALVRSISTSRTKRARFPQPRNAPLLARVVRTLLTSERFESLADLTDALKYRCAQLRISWAPHDITDAYRLVSSNTTLVRRPR